jgi:hypothetical protein
MRAWVDVLHEEGIDTVDDLHNMVRLCPWWTVLDYIERLGCKGGFSCYERFLLGHVICLIPHLPEEPVTPLPDVD